MILHLLCFELKDIKLTPFQYLITRASKMEGWKGATHHITLHYDTLHYTITNNICNCFFGVIVVFLRLCKILLLGDWL